MEHERWTLVDRLLGAALEREPDQRAAFLNEACAGDEALRDEVESLLGHHAGAGHFLESPALELLNAAPTAHTGAQFVDRQLGPYRILSQLGIGGMGEVYRARDSRLGREVAIKIATERFSERVEREARAVAALNHPNICTLHDVGPNYIVMELVEGDSPKGPLPLQEALRIARQIVQALEAAHEKGIVHRDLKPGNIKIKPDGVVKVLDFGLAKVDGAVATQPEDSPRRITATESGVILGTAAYMSPEQARGRPVDRRTDIWAFGVVLYELIVGDRPFRGDTVTDTLAAVVKEEPKWDQVPTSVRRLLRCCLQKDPKDRLRDIADARLLLEDVDTEAAPVRRSRLPWAVAPLFAVAMGIALWAPWRTAAPTLETIQTQVYLPENVNAAGRNFSLSPDGRTLALSAVGPDGVARVWVRSMTSLEVRALPGTETTPNPPPFFWSPDSRFIAYSAEGARLKKVDLAGSPPETLCETKGPNAPGGSWNRDGVIIFGSGSAGLTRVSAAGGAPSPVTALDTSRREIRHAYPTFLGDSRRFLYLRTSSSPENSGVYVGALGVKPEDQDSRRLVATTFAPVYVRHADGSGGYLLVMRDGDVVAYVFDEQRTQIVGDPVTVVQQVGSFVASGFFSASARALVYRPSASSQETRLHWWNRKGHFVGNPAQPGRIRAMALSPDGLRAALVRQDSGSADQNIWLWETTRENSTRLTFHKGRANAPVWTPDGRYIVFASTREGPKNLYRKAANESAKDEVLLKSDQDKVPTSISADGNFLLYTETNAQSKQDIWAMSNLGGGGGERKSAPFQRREFNEGEAQFSPESGTGAPRWVAYTSDETGRPEVYVREFPFNAESDKWPVSKAGGTNPRWRRDGKELFFAAPDGTVMSVEVPVGATFRAGEPKALFRVPAGLRSNWDLTADGERLLVLVPQDAPAPLTVWQNWQAVLSDRQPRRQ